MISPQADQRKAIRFFDHKVHEGFDMSKWKILRSHPTSLSPENLVLLAEHTGDDIGTLLSHGIGVNNRVCDMQQHFIMDRHGMRPRHAADRAA